MAVEKKDQRQLTGTSNAGFGEFTGTRYRGMGFIPAFDKLTAISFNAQSVGSKGVKVFIYAADSNSIPTGSELYSFVISNANLSTGLTKYSLPTPLTVTPGSQYCYYLAPWNTGTDAYDNDYRDFRWHNSDSYNGGKPIINSNGTWSVSDSGNLDAHFETYGKAVDEVGTIVTLRPNATGVTNNMDSAQGSGSPASKLVAINESTADDDVSYIYDPTLNREEYFNLADGQIPTGATINRIRVWLRWKSVDAVTSTCAIGIYIGSTKYLSDNKESRKQTDYRDDYYDWNTNPNTSSAWTLTDIDNLQIGIKNLNAVGKRFTQLFVEVDYSLTQKNVTDSGSGSEAVSITEIKTVTDKAEARESGPDLHSNDFSSNNLSTYYDTPAGTWSIASGILSNTSGGVAWNSRVLLTKKSDYKDFEIYCRVKKPTGKNNQIIFRSGSNNDGYGIQIRTDGTDSNFRLEHWGVSNLQNVTPLTWVSGNWYRVRIRVEGNRIRARVWDDTGVEPIGTWHIDYTGTNFSTGAIGFSAEDANADFDDLIIASLDPQVVQIISISDTGSLASEILSILNSFTVSESGAGSDSIVVDPGSTAITITDSGSGSEIISILAQIAISDSSNAAEAISILATIALSDSGVSSEAISALSSISISDSGSLSSEVISLLAQIVISDTVTSSEVISLLASLAIQDSVTGAEIINIISSFLLQDNSSGIDTIIITNSFTITDSGNSSELLSVLAQIVLSDTANSNEALSILAQVAITDSAVGSEALQILSNLVVSDSGSSSEALNILVNIAIPDSAVGNEALTLLVNIALSETAVSSETILVLLITGLFTRGGQLSNTRTNLYNRLANGLYNKR